MKKLFLMALVALMSLQSVAQIGKITTNETKYDFEFFGSLTLYKDWKSGDTIYSIIVNSTNDYEEKAAWLKLGNKSSAKKSIENLLATYNKHNSNFTLQGYSMSVDDGNYITIHNTGKLNYTAGSYSIYIRELKDIYNRFCEQTYVGYKVTKDRLYIFSKPQSKYSVEKDGDYWSNDSDIPCLEMHNYRGKTGLSSSGNFSKGYISVSMGKLYVNDTISTVEERYVGIFDGNIDLTDVNWFVNHVKPGSKISFVYYSAKSMKIINDRKNIETINRECTESIEEFVLTQEQYDEIVKFYVNNQ